MKFSERVDEENLIEGQKFCTRKQVTCFSIILTFVALLLLACVGLTFCIALNIICLSNCDVTLSSTEAPSSTQSVTTTTSIIFNKKIDELSTQSETTKSKLETTTTGNVYTTKVDEISTTTEESTTENPFESHPNFQMFDNPMSSIVGTSVKIQHAMQAPAHKFPWTVAIFVEGINKIKNTTKDYFWCSGSLIHAQWIVTAAHCLIGVDNENFSIEVSSIRLGAHLISIEEDGIKVFSKGEFKTFVHDDYNKTSHLNDIGLINLLQNKISSTSPKILPIFLPFYEKDVPSRVNITGWGATEKFGNGSGVLMHETLKTINGEECAAIEPVETYSLVTSKQFCGAGRTTDNKHDVLTCKGDSGGPAFATVDKKPVLFGLTSFSQNYQYCGHDRGPTVFVKIYDYIEWILNTTMVSFEGEGISTTEFEDNSYVDYPF